MATRSGLNFGSLISARNLPRSLTSPSHSVFTKEPAIIPSNARSSRLTWASFQRRSSTISLVACESSLSRTVCANAPPLSRQKHKTDLIAFALIMFDLTILDLITRLQSRARPGGCARTLQEHNTWQRSHEAKTSPQEYECHLRTLFQDDGATFRAFKEIRQPERSHRIREANPMAKSRDLVFSTSPIN